MGGGEAVEAGLEDSTMKLRYHIGIAVGIFLALPFIGMFGFEYFIWVWGIFD